MTDRGSGVSPGNEYRRLIAWRPSASVLTAPASSSARGSSWNTLYTTPANVAPTIGATQNSQSCPQRPSAHEDRRSRAARRIHRQVGHRNPDQVDQRQPQPDRDRRESLRRPPIGRAQNDHQEHEGQHDFGRQARAQRISARRMLVVAVGGETIGQAESFLARSRSHTARPIPQFLPAPARSHRPAAPKPESGCATTSPTDTAGFTWHPEMWPIANAIVSTVKPNASATPANPIPRPGKAAASTAAPQPPNTSQNVPMNSAKDLFESDMQLSSLPTTAMLPYAT